MRPVLFLAALAAMTWPAAVAAQTATSPNRALQTQVRPMAGAPQQAASPEVAVAKADLAAIDREIADLRQRRDSAGGLSETQQVRLQMLMDRRAKALETLSNMMKKSSETAASITGNLK